MNQTGYLSELAKLIHTLPQDEQTEIMKDYEDHFALALLHGRSEEDIISRLGTPKKVAKEIIVQFNITRAQSKPTLRNILKAVGAAMGLGIVNLLVVLIPFSLLILIPALLFAVSVMLLFSPILLLIQDGLTLVYLQEMFVVVGLVGAGMIMLVGTLRIGSIVYRLTLRYLRYNLQVVRGKMG